MQINNIQMPQLRDIGQLKEKANTDDFKFTLISRIEESQLQERINEMVMNIQQQGNKIATHMDIRDIKVYRQLISEFINEVTVNSHKFSRENTIDKRGRHRVYGIIRNINSNLDDIARELMKSEKNSVAILNKIGEINGLVLDITT